MNEIKIQKTLLERVFYHLRIIILAGLAVWLPIVITIWLISFIVNLLDKVQVFLPHFLQPSQLYGRDITGFGILSAIIILLITGLVTSNFIGLKLLKIWDTIVKKIPIVNSIYKSVKQVSDTFFSTNSNAFREAVMVEFPRKGAWTIGFVTTREMPPHSYHNFLDKPIGIFVPTTPNPTSGYIIWISENEICKLDISIEQALKLVISMGVVSGKSTEITSK